MDFAALIKDYGVGVALLIYFVWKDATFTGRITELMTDVKSLLQEVRNNPTNKVG